MKNARRSKASKPNMGDHHGAWLMGFMQGHPCATIQDAIDWWQDQERMAAEFERQRAAA